MSFAEWKPPIYSRFRQAQGLNCMLKKILQDKDNVALEQAPSISEDFYILLREFHG